MKNVLSLLFVFFFTQLFGQDQYVRSGSVEKVKSSYKKGEMLFYLPEEIKEEDVKESAAYYTLYFSVQYIAKENAALIRFTDNQEKNRRVMVRFFISLGVESIQLGDEVYSPQAFFDKCTQLSKE